MSERSQGINIWDDTREMDHHREKADISELDSKMSCFSRLSLSNTQNLTTYKNICQRMDQQVENKSIKTDKIVKIYN